MARSNKKSGAERVDDARNAVATMDIDMDTKPDGDDGMVGGRRAQDASVRLTDISEIVAKYSVVDRFFTPEADPDAPEAETAPTRERPEKAERQDNRPDPEDREEDAEAARRKARIQAEQRAARELAERREARAEAERRVAREEAERRAARAEAERRAERQEEERRAAWSLARQEVPDEPVDDEDDDLLDEDDGDIAAAAPRPNLFGSFGRMRRARDDEDDLQSNWRDTAKDAFEEMHAVKAIYPDYTSPLKEATPVPAAGAVVRPHKRALAHTVALCAALPIVAGVTFALTLYVQKDIQPTELWAWATESMNGSETPGHASPTPVAAAANALMTSRVEGSDTQPITVAPNEQAAAVSPEILNAPSAQSPVAAPQYSVPPAADSQGSPATQYFMAHLTVADAQGTASQPIPLAFNVTRARPEQRLRIRISGIPDGGKLSAGRDLGNGEWRLRENDLENLTMTLPAGYTGDITLLAMVIDDATHIQAGAPSTMQVHVTSDTPVVEPASAPPANVAPSFATPDIAAAQQPARGVVVPQSSLFPELNMQFPQVRQPEQTVVPETRVASTAPATSTLPRSAPVAQSMTSQEVDNLISKGDRMMGLGDMASARLFYERANKSGDPRAAIAMGKTFDPLVFGQLNIRGVTPDPQKALSWYSQGAETGNPEAIAHFEALDAYLRQ